MLTRRFWRTTLVILSLSIGWRIRRASLSVKPGLGSLTGEIWDNITPMRFFLGSSLLIKNGVVLLVRLFWPVATRQVWAGPGAQRQGPGAGPAGLGRPPYRDGPLVRPGKTPLGHGVRRDPNSSAPALRTRLRDVRQSEGRYCPLVHPRAQPPQHQGMHRPKGQ